ncbi:hypothetical protein DEM27_28615 [Metarhizobium album]|uniref:Uncharacterized protein n=1 Tax=Metarhizobium album TaxID=2182425 RepID=A0A2U2DHV2_9HYPH|nr:hypothetical protein [Rhizobium album]PWE52893.1 hypothetical protein DEM27_28615 [Rhizobium album]
MTIETSPLDAVRIAADWIAQQPSGVRIPDIRDRFGLSALEACQAIKLARNVEPKEATSP